MEPTTKKVVIEAITCTNYVWELVKVNGSIAWRQYMEIVSQPEAAIHGKPMVYVNFVHRVSGNPDDAEASTSGQAQPEPEDGSTECAASEGSLVPNFVPNEGPETWWSARIDCHEYLSDEALGLESDEDTDPSSDGTDEDAHEAGGPYVASRLDDIAARSLVRPQEEGSQWGFEADTLLVGKRFPDKVVVQQAIARYALSISRVY